MALEIVQANSIFPAQKILIYGVQGIGKNTMAATFESPILLQIEDGSEAIDIPAYPLVTKFQDIVDIIQDLHSREHNYKTLVVDTIDWMEPLIWQSCCQERGWASIEDPGYGKGYLEVDKWWRYVMDGMDALRRNRGMNIVVLAHSEIKRIEPPDLDAYDTYQIKMQRRAFALWQEWAGMVLFLNYKTNISKVKTGDNVRVRGTGTGDRIIYTTERPAYKAKSRWPLPEEIIIGKDKTWLDFHKALNVATDGKYALPSHYSKK